ncbi:NTP pyrophosphohydrolase [Pseudoclavibacter endophyticus]|uniref:NAD(+) diphosphatase n=1 Tax=Pseudoclavibacter endophyticus TaxID=1778590 RepID=A0A6H9WNW4_9MICO|nr:NAD(+) diphosphatase [Pseudoclavibacter endophyticus]KAB1649788.1 NAD(+) diphosphatase [Pseudoclavibacter endophyticus]GGA59748.1 NTP pyrophosphohydrolase [Pseudoclavibacter endophyticus]
MLDFPSRLPLATQAIDRDDVSRGDAALWRGIFTDPAARVLLLHRGQSPSRRTERGPILALRRMTEAPWRLEEHRAVYLGRTEIESRSGMPPGTRVVSYSITDAERNALDDVDETWVDLRVVGVDLDDVDAGLFTAAAAMQNWHESMLHAPDSGRPTRPTRAGWVRLDEHEGGREHFPRTDAAVIAAVIDQNERLLLGANARWTPRRYSLLAGFVEPGESFEAAVVREVREESGARVVRPRYLGSQPWPFPASIMVGFMGELDPEQDPESIRPDKTEIADVRWFTRDEVRDNRHLLPPHISIARAIIEEWYGGALDD